MEPVAGHGLRPRSRSRVSRRQVRRVRGRRRVPAPEYPRSSGHRAGRQTKRTRECGFPRVPLGRVLKAAGDPMSDRAHVMSRKAHGRRSPDSGLRKESPDEHPASGSPSRGPRAPARGLLHPRHGAVDGGEQEHHRAIDPHGGCPLRRAARYHPAEPALPSHRRRRDLDVRAEEAASGVGRRGPDRRGG